MMMIQIILALESQRKKESIFDKELQKKYKRNWLRQLNLFYTIPEILFTQYIERNALIKLLLIKLDSQGKIKAKYMISQLF
ncbi:unnamed protein product [Paramecium octaurelia]|uniref:Uncharacterized protein n=1 Tax=Paramecium octaurelia TaxID=43137 RepID=A0A8S1XFQ6_PAROT|nr:unnamed protein product [Paramecium octaurelia]